MSTRIYGTLFFKKGKIKAIRHVISPEVSFSFSPDFTGLSADVPVEIAIVNYETIADSFSGSDADSISSTLSWGNPLAGEDGVPNVENTVVLNGVTGIIPVTVDSALELIASPVSD